MSMMSCDYPTPGQQQGSPVFSASKGLRGGWIINVIAYHMHNSAIDLVLLAKAATTDMPTKQPTLNRDEPHQARISLSKRFSLEPSHPFFSLDEPSTAHAAKIDAFATFAPSPSILVLPFRWAMLYWSMQVLYEDVTTYPPHNLYIYMGYLTHWGFLLTICYLMCSFLCSAVGILTTCWHRWIIPNADASPLVLESLDVSKTGRLFKTTWLLFSIAAPLEICICVLYWTAVASNGPVTYVSLMEHGVFAIVVLVDGLLIGRIPLRIPQVIFLWTVCWCYLGWSLIDAYCDIGNGEWGPAYTDDALYPVLNWKQQSRLATIVSTFCLVVLTPGVFWLVWLLSLLSGNGADGGRRHLLVVPEPNAHTEVEYKRMDQAVMV